MYGEGGENHNRRSRINRVRRGSIGRHIEPGPDVTRRDATPDGCGGVARGWMRNVKAEPRAGASIASILGRAGETAT